MSSTTPLTKMIYIASPYTSHKEDPIERAKEEMDRYMDITETIGALQDIYDYAFIGPITQSHNTAMFMKSPSTAFESWAIRDKTYLSRCDELWVVMLEGWDLSTGVKEEIAFAQLENIPIYYVIPKIYGILDKPCPLLMSGE